MYFIKNRKILLLFITFFLPLIFFTACADAGDDQRVHSGDKVILDGSNSSGDIISYHWEQIKGQKVDLKDVNSQKAYFIAPNISNDEKLSFKLTTQEIKNGKKFSSSDTTDVVVLAKDKNNPPTAKITRNYKKVYVGNRVVFDASSSSDSDGEIVRYEWSDTFGKVLSREISFTKTFKSVGVFKVNLKVTDNKGAIGKDSMTITIKPTLDRTPPKITIKGDNPLTLGYKDEYIEYGAKAVDDVDGNVSVTIENDVNTSKLSEYKVIYRAKDSHNNEANATRVVYVKDLKAPVITIKGANPLTIYQDSNYIEYGAEAIDDVDGNISDKITIENGVDTSTIGEYKVVYKISDNAGNEANATRVVKVIEPILESLKVEPNPITTRVNQEREFTIIGHYSNNKDKTIEDANISLANSAIANINGNTIEGLQEGQSKLFVQKDEINTTVDVIVGKELNTTNINKSDFASNYIDQIPIDATKTQYDQERFAIINGLVIDENNQPLSGVKVIIYNHPEYGSVTTKDDGSFVIPVEGGLKLTLRYTKDGYSTVDRELEVKVQEWNTLPKVMMLQEDSKVTQIDLNSSKIQVHISSPTVDDRGERKAALVFDGISKATVRSSDGTVRELRNFSVRATEFKTPESMPGELPKTSAYTYCVDMKVDGVSDNERVDFDAPVVVYVENFLGFDVGEIVPSGYYDRKQGKWVGSKNGVVVELLDTNNDGLVDALDSNGDGKPDDLNGNGDFSDEVAGIANKSGYSAGKTYWRVEITHFTPWDFNWPWGPPPDATPPKDPDAKPDTQTPPLSCKANIDSSVDFKARVLHEDIPIAGTNITLHYTSNRVAGKKYIIESDYNATDTSSSLYAAYATLSVAGKEFKQDIEQGRVNHLKFIWDGKDALGRYITGKVTATLTIHYRYPLVMYSASSDFAQAWAQAGSSATNIIGREQIEYTSSQTIEIDVQKSKKNNSNIANGWSFSNIHRLEVNRVYKGNGEIVKKSINIDKGLIAYYKFDGNVRDSSGNSYDGVLFGELQYKEGIIGQSAVFNGTQHIKTPIELIGIPENQYITISLWGKSKNSQNTTFITNANIGDYSNSITLNSSSVGIVGRFNGYWSRGFCYKYKLIDLINIEPKKEDNCGNVDTYETIYDYGTNPVDYTKWHHYVITYDNLYERIYIDGVKVIEKELEPNMIGGPNKIPRYPRDDNDYDRFLNIGQYNNVFNYSESYVQKTRLVGEIDDLRIYKRVLSDKEIKAIYNYGLSGKSNYDINGIKISDYNLEYIFDNNGKHLATYSFPSHKLLEKFTYDNNGNLVKITDRFNHSIEIIRDSNGQITQIIAPTGQVTNLSIDENNNLREVSYEDGSKYEFNYNVASLLTQKIKLDDSIVKYNFNEYGRLVSEIDSIGAKYSFDRKVENNSTIYTLTYPLGEKRVSKDTIDSLGNLSSIITLPTGAIIEANQTANELKQSYKIGDVLKEYSYAIDPLTNQKILQSLSIKEPSGLTKNITYSVNYDGNQTHTNKKTTTITINQNTTTIVNDYNSGEITTTTPEQRVIKEYYNPNTLLTNKLQIGTLNPIEYSYNEKGYLRDIKIGDREVSFSYNDRGNIVSYTNQIGLITNYTYDTMDRVTSITYPNGVSEYFSYDKAGNLIKRVVPNNKEHKFSYNPLHQRTNYKSALNKQTNYFYNKDRRLNKITLPSSKEIHYNYSHTLLSSISSENDLTEFIYNSNKQLSNIKRANEEIAYSYDGDLLTNITYRGSINNQISFSYNSDFNIKELRYANSSYQISYNKDNQIIAIGNYTLTRDSNNGYVTKVSDGTLTKEYNYNNYAELIELKNPTFSYNLQRDNLGLITKKDETINNKTISYTYTYDKLNRLIKVTKDNQVVEEYNYDENGNRVSATIYNKTIQANYTLDDQLIVYGNNSYRYNDDGYLIQKTTPQGETTYTYSDFGELIKVVTPTKTIEYIYNPNHQRVAKLVNGKVTQKYLWLDLTTLLAILDKDGNTIQKYEYANQRVPIALIDKNNNKYYLHYDQVGSLRAISDINGNIVKEITYDSYGNILSDSNPDFKVPFGFAGGLHDSDTGLVHFGYREYDPCTGKWTAKDPILFAGGDSNLYGYVLQDPVNWVDPEGLNAQADYILKQMYPFNFADALNDQTRLQYNISRSDLIDAYSDLALLVTLPFSYEATIACKVGLSPSGNFIGHPAYGGRTIKMLKSGKFRFGWSRNNGPVLRIGIKRKHIDLIQLKPKKGK